DYYCQSHDTSSVFF
nr:immunoglobulin light chain junction region [Macaca mulatta]MOV67282.1 immunoglobulin light chain junction region [Macaca mulatta]MOV68366.1 immunoglobulin light chain junction region [Macaca mulatta]MOV69132.1 immunoglobulin light chain junction region [Macaca mulatta]MOV69680.1 immunoglobulin light chain junction region [Macaca mulatta]